MNYKVAVFAYDFCHKKTQDILINLYIFGIRDVVVFLAPKVKIADNSIHKPYTSITDEDLTHPRVICTNLEYKYYVYHHNNFDEISKSCDDHKRNLALISGARILKKNIISLFHYGVINYHPGSLPETSGLNSIFWMIRKNARPVASAHFIDEKVDAGRLIDEQQIHLYQDDTISIVEYKLYIAQLNLHKKICQKIFYNETISAKNIERISKNEPMNHEEINTEMIKFKLWKKNHV
jgi:folate-dependent phosphoribosylglycinamide formyltransferase PurN